MKKSKYFQERIDELKAAQEELTDRYDGLLWDLQDYCEQLERALDDWEQGEEADREVAEYTAQVRRENGFPSY